MRRAALSWAAVGWLWSCWRGVHELREWISLFAAIGTLSLAVIAASAGSRSRTAASDLLSLAVPSRPGSLALTSRPGHGTTVEIARVA
jgi:hypothetical protein